MDMSLRDVTWGRDRLAELIALQVKHGYNAGDRRNFSAHDWSQVQLALGENTDEAFREICVQHDLRQTSSFPRNAPFLDFLAEKFKDVGFVWRVENVTNRKGRPVDVVVFDNYPTVSDGGRAHFPTLAALILMPVEMIDGYEDRVKRHAMAVGEMVDEFATSRQVMDDTGVGYKGFSGVSWLAIEKPFELPAHFAERTTRLAKATFALHDAVQALLEQGNPRIMRLVETKVPSRISDLTGKSHVQVIRPDIIVVQDADGSYRPVVTELESAPGGQGMAYAMQCGYGLSPTIADEFATFLSGRPYRILATHEWGEYAFDQATFVAALRERGVDAELWFDAPLSRVAEIARAWQCPSGAPLHMRDAWNTDILNRLEASGFMPFVRGFEPNDLPQKLAPETNIFRFGYYDNFSDEALAWLAARDAEGMPIVNGLAPYHECKAFMGAAWEDEVAAWIRAHSDPEYVDILQSCMAETRLLDPTFISRGYLEEHRKSWLTKYAAWDGNNESWGSRSISVGSEHTTAMWQQELARRFALPHPVVAQHVIGSATFDVGYVDHHDRLQLLNGARTRVTPFFIRRTDGTVESIAATMTLRTGSMRIHGATDAVEGPIVYRC